MRRSSLSVGMVIVQDEFFNISETVYDGVVVTIIVIGLSNMGNSDDLFFKVTPTSSPSNVIFLTAVQHLKRFQLT